MNKAPRTMDDPAEKMAELESEIERQDAERQQQEEQTSKYAPKPEPGEERVKETAAAQKPAEVNEEPQPAKTEEKPEEPAKKQEAGEPKPSVQAETSVESVPAHGDSGEKANPDAGEHGKKDEHEQDGGKEDEKPKHLSSLWLNVLIVVCVLLVGTMGYLFYEQNRTMPDDPLEKALNEKEITKELYRKKKLEFNEVRIRDLKNQKLKTKNQELYELRQALGQKEKTIDDLQREMASIRAQMKSYFGIYKDYARRKARNLQFDSLTTVKTNKTYLNVSIRRVTDHAVSIVHAGGATNLDPEDLSDALRNRLAFGDPLGLSDMDKEKAEEEGKKQDVGKYLPATETFGKPEVAPAQPQPQARPSNAVDVDALLKQDFDPPSKLPNIETTPAASNAVEAGF